MNVTLRPWRYALDQHYPLTLRAAAYVLVLDDLPLEPDAALRAMAARAMTLHAERHRYVLPTARPSACADLCGPNAWPAVWVAHPLGELDVMRVSTLWDVPAWCRIVLSPRRSGAVLAAARTVGAVVLEAQR